MTAMLRSNFSNAFAVIPASLILTTAVSQAALVYYDIAPQNPTSYALAAAVTSKDALVTATSIGSATTPVGSVGPGNFSVSNSSGSAFLEYSQSNSTLAGAITDQDYIQFSVTVSGANLMSLSNLQFNHRAEAGVTSNLAVFASLTGFASAPAATDVLGTGTTSSNTNTTSTIDLSSPLYQNLSNTTVTFRIYGYDNGSNTLNYGRLDNITLNGIVPEPSSALLSLIPAPLLFARRRR